LHSSPRAAARIGTATGLGLAIVRELARAMGGEAAAIDSAEAPRPRTDSGPVVGDAAAAAPTSKGAHLVVRLPLLGTAPPPS
ncbi:MAG: hypothetical protein ACRD0R_01375, partial [Acidimicrobiales bacterium]